MTLVGGLVALKLERRTTLMLAAAAGIVLGVAFFDLLPEALGMASSIYSDRLILTCTAGGFMSYLALNRVISRYERRITWKAHLGPASLTLHSFLDGAAMGLAFQVSPSVGWIVALAVLTHDLADGVNTVSLALAASRKRVALCWLLANGAAPLIGVMLGLVVRLENALLAPIMGAFAGVFLYIGSCELVPRSFERDPRLRTTASVLAGVSLMFALSFATE
jgi:ZIP family zinc transporter